MHRLSSLATLLSATTLLAACNASTTDTLGVGGDPKAGLYTAAQAADGGQAYESYCAHCHAPSYFQGAFLDPWRGQSVQTLFDLVRLKMPEDRPDAMNDEEYVAVMAYIFALNDFPAGNLALGSGSNVMAEITIPTASSP